MTPREIIAGCIGLVVGAILASICAEPCRKGCCVNSSEARRDRWRRGEDPGEPPRHAHNGLCAHPKDEPCKLPPPPPPIPPLIEIRREGQFGSRPGPC